MTERREATRLAEQLISQGKYERAVEAYKDLLKENPDDIAFNNALGDLCVRIGRGEEAVPFFLKVADTYQQTGFRKKAIATLKKAHRQSPADTTVVERLASLHIQEGLAAEARRLLLELAWHHQQHARLPEAREAYRKVAEIDPHYIPALLKLSELAAAEGDSEAEYVAYCAVGRELAAAGRLQEAVELLGRALEADPDHREAARLLADLLRESGELDKALELYRRLLEADPRDAELLAALGEIAIEDGDEKATADYFHRAREINPESERVLLLGSRIASMRGDVATALVYLDPLVDRLLEERREGPAVATLEEIAAQTPGHVEILEKLKSIYIFLGNKERLANLLARLSDALEETANYAGAIEAAEQLQDLEPDKLAHKDRLERLHGLRQGAVMFGDDEQPPPQPLAEAEEAGPSALPVEAEVDPAIERILLEADTFLRYGLRKKARERLEAGLVSNADNAVLHQRLARILVDEEELEGAVQSFARAADLWEERGKPDMAAQLKMEIAELVAAGEEPLPEPALEPRPEPAAAEAAEQDMDTLEGQLAEAEYYLDQAFLSPAHQLLSSLRERNPDHSALQDLWNRLRSMASVELDAAEVEKDLDDFFAPLESVAGGEPAAAPASEESITSGLEKELYALHGAAERRLDKLTDEKKVDAEQILSHLPTGAVDSLMQEDFAIHFELGTAYMETGLLVEAITEFQLAAEDPDLHQKACLNLGSCFRQRGMDGAALVWLERGLTAGGDEEVMAETLLNMALIHKAHGRQEKYRSAVEQLKSLAPEHPGLESIIESDS